MYKTRLTPEDIRDWFYIENGDIKRRHASPENGIKRGDSAIKNRNGSRTVKCRGVELAANRVAWVLHHDIWPSKSVYMVDESGGFSIENLIEGAAARHILKTKRTCRECGVQFQVQASTSKAKFCSRKCYWSNSTKNARICKFCGAYLGAKNYGRRVCSSCLSSQYRSRRLAKKYGLSISDFEVLIRRANYKCQICGETPDSGPVVDHSHVTGKIRGILCHNCNLALGLFKDSKDTLNNAIEYLNSAVS